MRRVSRSGVPWLVVLGALACLGLAQARNTAPPDFTGIWTTYSEPGQAGRGRGSGGQLPLTDEAKKRIAAYRAVIGSSGDTPGGFCLGTGMPGSMLGSGGYPMEIHQRPEQLIIVYEAHNEIRRVYLGSRIVPESDRLPGRNGHSSGRWEGDTLVVESTGFDERTYIMPNGWFHSEELRVVERYTRPSMNYLIVEITVDDPKVLTKPWKSAPRRWTLGNGEIYEFYCTNNRELEELEKVRELELQKK